MPIFDSLLGIMRDLDFLHKKDVYNTKKNSRKFIDKLFLNTRLYFAIKYMQLVLINRRLAIKGRYDRVAWSLSSFKVIKLIEDCGGCFHIEGLNHIRNCNEPVVFVSNHMSAMESMILPALIAPFMEVTFVVKESLTTHPFFGPVMRSCEPIAVARTNSREDLIYVINKGKEFLDKGTSIVIFPQGKRQLVFNPKEFNSLGIKLAKKVGVKVIPIALKTDFWGNGTIIKDFGPIRRDRKIFISIGEALKIENNGKKQNNQIIDFIQENLNTWNR